MRNPSRSLGVYVLEHPYKVFRPSGTKVPELGAIVVCDVRAGQGAFEALLSLAELAPWCACCALLPTGMPMRELMEVLELLPARCSKLPIEPDTNPFDPDPVITAVAQRPSPSPFDIAEYIAQRIAWSAVIPILAACLGRHEDTRNSRSYLSRRLKALPPFTARDWAAVGHLVALRQATRWPAGRLAREHGLDPRTLRAWTSRYLALPWSTVQQLAGWEWIVEAALRRGGYAAEPMSEVASVENALGA
ncbi:MAG: hypothetical protein ACJ8BF_04350 [Gemmatimonadales bacterium]